MRRRLYIGAAVVWAASLVAAYLTGKHDAPVKTTETTTRTDESARLSAFLASLETQQKTETRRHVVTRTVRKPDGTVERVRVEDSGTHTASTATSNVTGHSTETTASTAATARVTERSGRPDLRVALGVGLDLGRPLSLDFKAVPVANAEIEKRIVGIGPVDLRAYAKASASLANLKDVTVEAGAKAAGEFGR